MPPLPVRDLSATHLALVLVWFGFTLCLGEAVPLPELRRQNLPSSIAQSVLCPPSCHAVLLLECTEPVGQELGWLS